MTTFLKYVGGKRSSAEKILSHRPLKMDRYIEPFLGGGAVFFALRASGWDGPAILGDVNHELMLAYEIVRDRSDDLIEHLSSYQNNEEAYYAARSTDPSTLPDLKRAARLIYLNKTAFNGLWRENKSGQMNTPFGHYKNPTICDEAKLRSASSALQNTTLYYGEFGGITAALNLNDRDFIYCDPPYLPTSATANFLSYHSAGFNLTSQEHLVSTALFWAARGARVVLSNADVPLAHKLYPVEKFASERLECARAINSQGDKRGKVGELLFVARLPL